MDTDVELLRSLDDFLELQSFSGFEAYDRMPTGLMASCRQQSFFVKLLNDYDNRRFVLPDGGFDLTTNVESITKACVDAGAVLDNSKQTVEGFTLFPSDYFCPKDPADLKLHLTKNSYAIHHFDGSWVTPKERFNRRIAMLIGPRMTSLAKKILKRS